MQSVDPHDDFATPMATLELPLGVCHILECDRALDMRTHHAMHDELKHALPHVGSIAHGQQHHALA